MLSIKNYLILLFLLVVVSITRFRESFQLKFCNSSTELSIESDEESDSEEFQFKFQEEVVYTSFITFSFKDRYNSDLKSKTWLSNSNIYSSPLIDPPFSPPKV
jgi:hypothetical protein